MQAIPLLAEEADELIVLQRTATYVVPAGNQTLAADARRVLELNAPGHPWLQGDWPNYPWMIRKLNPFAGEKSATTGQRNATMNRK